MISCNARACLSLERSFSRCSCSAPLWCNRGPQHCCGLSKPRHDVGHSVQRASVGGLGASIQTWHLVSESQEGSAGTQHGVQQHRQAALHSNQTLQDQDRVLNIWSCLHSDQTLQDQDRVSDIWSCLHSDQTLQDQDRVSDIWSCLHSDQTLQDQDRVLDIWSCLHSDQTLQDQDRVLDIWSCLHSDQTLQDQDRVLDIWSFLHSSLTLQGQDRDPARSRQRTE